MIGGNRQAVIQMCRVAEVNAIGEAVIVWEDVGTLTGFLDYSGGEADYTAYDAKIKEATHVFIGDYVALDDQITEENSRMVIDGAVYDIKLIDDPMELHKHLEIFLKYTGGQ